MLSYQLGSWLFCGAAFSIGTVIALIIVAAILYALFRPGYKGNERK